MAKKFKKSRRRRARIFVRTAQPDSTLQNVTSTHLPFPKLNAIRYTEERIEDFLPTDIRTIAALREPNAILCLQVIGVENAAAINEMGAAFGLHPLALEDAVNVHQRPKSEGYEDHVFVVLRIPQWLQQLEFDQVSFFLGANYVVMIQERTNACFDPVLQRLKSARSRIRRSGSDYLMYALTDAVLDCYYPIVERYNDRLEEIENEILSRKATDYIAEVHAIRHELHMLRRTLLPTREALSNLVRDEVGLIQPDTNVFLRDCQDHTAQLLDAIETCQNLSSGLIDLHLSSVTAHTNEIMKMLTLISTIFMPLSFVAGVYGMNFDRQASPWNMPELGWPWGYPLVLGIMGAITIGFLIFFQRRGWFGKSKVSVDGTAQPTASQEEKLR